MIYTNYYNSPIGRITMASEGTALIGLWFEGQKYFADSIKEECTEKDLDILMIHQGGLIFILVEKDLILHQRF